MAGYNLPDNVSPKDPAAPWNQELKITRVRLKVHYAGQVQEFEAEWDWCPTEEEASLDFGENYHVEVEYPDEN
jgi:hypothetical protein